MVFQYENILSMKFVFEMRLYIYIYKEYIYFEYYEGQMNVTCQYNNI